MVGPREMANAFEPVRVALKRSSHELSGGNNSCLCASSIGAVLPRGVSGHAGPSLIPL